MTSRNWDDCYNILSVFLEGMIILRRDMFQKKFLSNFGITKVCDHFYFREKKKKQQKKKNSKFSNDSLCMEMYASFFCYFFYAKAIAVSAFNLNSISVLHINPIFRNIWKQFYLLYTWERIQKFKIKNNTNNSTARICIQTEKKLRKSNKYSERGKNTTIQSQLMKIFSRIFHFHFLY